MGQSSSSSASDVLNSVRSRFMQSFQQMEGRRFGSRDLYDAYNGRRDNVTQLVTPQAVIEFLMMFAMQYGLEESFNSKELLKELMVINPSCELTGVGFSELKMLFFRKLNRSEMNDLLSSSLNTEGASYKREQARADVATDNWIVVRVERKAPDSLFPLGKREWSLIFHFLPFASLAQVSLTCRYYFYVLQEAGPPQWRRLDLSSLEQRTHADIPSLLVHNSFSKMRHLNIGKETVANMLNGEQLVTVVNNLSFLTSLSLRWCHLIHDTDWFAIEVAPALQTLYLFNTRAPYLLSMLDKFPRLTGVGSGKVSDVNFPSIFKRRENDDQMPATGNPAQITRLLVRSLAHPHHLEDFTNIQHLYVFENTPSYHIPQRKVDVTEIKEKLPQSITTLRYLDRSRAESTAADYFPEFPSFRDMTSSCTDPNRHIAYREFCALFMEN